MILGIDHIVILVSDLATARADYERLGFTVVEGGEHTGGATHNVLVAFADGSYLELIAFKRPAPDHRWWDKRDGGEGVVDYALLPDDIARDIAAAQRRGVAYQGPTPGGRVRPDGQSIAWRLGLPPTPDLPFLCADVTPRRLRVPSGAAWQHPNGAMGVAVVRVAVADLGASVARYQALLDCPPLSTSEASDEKAVFALGAATVQLVSANGAAAAEHLKRYGEGPYSLKLRVSSGATSQALDAAATHGARLEWASMNGD